MDNLIPKRESLTVEFKSGRDRLPDNDLVAAVVCLANTDGGELFVGVEPDGSVSGLHATHQNVAGLAAMIANRSVPPLSVRVESIDTKDGRIAKVSVPKSRQLTATSEGLLQRRRLKADGQPECVPFYPHEFGQRHSDLGLLDYSALPVANSTIEAIQKDEAKARSVLERLVEAGLVEAHGVKKGRTFTLAASVYREMDDKEGYVRQVGFEPIQQEQMALKYAKEHGRITRREAA